MLRLLSPRPCSGTTLAGSRSGSGGTEFHGHVFPVAGPHGTRGAIGEFGAPRDGGRTHEGFDIVAACGTPLVAVRGGRVRSAGYDPVLYGNYLLIHGEGERRSYFYAHLRRPASVHRGEPRLHRRAGRGRRRDRQRAHRRLSPALRDPRRRAPDRPASPRCGAGTATAESPQGPGDELGLGLRVGVAIIAEARGELPLQGGVLGRGGPGSARRRSRKASSSAIAPAGRRAPGGGGGSAGSGRACRTSASARAR